MAYCKIKGKWIHPDKRVTDCYKQLPKKVQRLLGVDWWKSELTAARKTSQPTWDLVSPFDIQPAVSTGL
jgi:hypothetical protein